MFQTKVDKIKTHFMVKFLFLNSCHLWDNVETYGGAGLATDENTGLIRRIININCFSTRTIFTRTRLNVAFIRSLPLMLLLVAPEYVTRWECTCNVMSACWAPIRWSFHLNHSDKMLLLFTTVHILQYDITVIWDYYYFFLTERTIYMYNFVTFTGNTHHKTFSLLVFFNS